jgi:hypothetical protein
VLRPRDGGVLRASMQNESADDENLGLMRYFSARRMLPPAEQHLRKSPSAGSIPPPHPR